MSLVRVRILIGLSFCILFSNANAQFTYYPFASTHSTALGGVMATGLSEASNIILNPAALPEVEQTQMQLVTSFQFNDLRFTPSDYSGSADSNSSLSFCPTASIAFDMNSRIVGLGMSISTFENYHTSFPADGYQRYQINQFDFTSGSVDFAIGYIPVRDLSLGLKIGYLTGLGEWDRSQNSLGSEIDLPSEYDVDWKIKFKSTSDLNLSGGVIWSPSYRFELGATYRPNLAYHFKPSMAVHFPDSLGGSVIKSDLADIRMRIPQEARLGMHWIASERIDLYLDTVWTEYSKIETIQFSADNPAEPMLPADVFIPMKCNDVYRIHSGIEFVLTHQFNLRFGGFFASPLIDDSNATVLFPSGSKIGINAGLGILFPRFSIDIALGHNFTGTNKIDGMNFPYPISGELETSDNYLQLGIKWML